MILCHVSQHVLPLKPPKIFYIILEVTLASLAKYQESTFKIIFKVKKNQWIPPTKINPTKKTRKNALFFKL